MITLLLPCDSLCYSWTPAEPTWHRIQMTCKSPLVSNLWLLVPFCGERRTSSVLSSCLPCDHTFWCCNHKIRLPHVEPSTLHKYQLQGRTWRTLHHDNEFVIYILKQCGKAASTSRTCAPFPWSIFVHLVWFSPKSINRSNPVVEVQCISVTSEMNL